jgi:hypothetical protein
MCLLYILVQFTERKLRLALVTEIRRERYVDPCGDWSLSIQYVYAPQ